MDVPYATASITVAAGISNQKREGALILGCPGLLRSSSGCSHIYYYMFTQRACPCFSAGDLVGGRGSCHGGQHAGGVQEWGQFTIGVGRRVSFGWARLVVRGNVAVGESGQQQRVLKEGESGHVEIGRLQFGSGRLESGDRSTSSSGKVSGIATQKGRVVVIAGPTAVGKTRVALALAKQLGGEIISADSVQVYKGLNVGSAKTPVHEREGIPHHLLDMVLPTEEYTANHFFKDARAATEQVLAKGRVPIVVGGTGTYLRCYMNGKAGAPKATPEVDAAVEAEIRRLVSCRGGWEAGVCMLAQAGDPATAYSLERNDWYRLRRALEIVKVSGQPRGAFPKPYNYSLDHMDCSEWDYDYDFQCYFLYQHRADLYQWIDLRCEQMVAAPWGLLAEASWLLDLGLMPNTNSASRGIGYQEAMEFLVECREAGGMTTEERFLAFLSAFQQVSRNLVKKQLTWFRSDAHNEVRLFHWVDASQPLDNILDSLRKEYWRRPGIPCDLQGSLARKQASYKEGKVLKYYQVTNRIFSNSAAIDNVLEWIKQTQGGRKFAQSLI